MSAPGDAHSTNMVEDLAAGYWHANVDISRSPTPGISPKRMRTTYEDIVQDFLETNAEKDNELQNLARAEQSPASLGYDASARSFKELWFTNYSSGSPSSVRNTPANQMNLEELTAMELQTRRQKMLTGCIPCL